MRTMLTPTLFSHPKLAVPVASQAKSVVPAWTLRSPTAGIGTELLAHREKIEVTPSGSPFERSPVPMGRAHRRYTRAFALFPGECLKLETRWRSEVNSNCRYRSVNSQTTAIRLSFATSRRTVKHYRPAALFYALKGRGERPGQTDLPFYWIAAATSVAISFIAHERKVSFEVADRIGRPGV
jgi:hypothetical protein